MEWQCNHRLDGRQIHSDRAVVIGGFARAHRLEIPASAVDFEIFAGQIVRFPDRGKTRRFRRHNVDTATVIHRKIFNAGTYKFKHFVFDEAVFENRADKRNSNIVRPYPFFGLAF